MTTDSQPTTMVDMRTQRPELAGEIVTFKTRACGDVTISAVRSALTLAGLDSDEARDLLPANAFRRALRQMAKDRLIDQLEDSVGSVRFQLTRQCVDESGLVDYDREAVLTLDEQQHVVCDEAPEMAVAAEELVSRVIGVRTASDLKSLVKRMFQKATTRELFCVNSENGGTYFVPERHREFTAKIDTFLRELDGELGRFPVPKGTPEGNASIGSAINEGIETYVQQLDDVVDNWDTGTMAGTQERYAERYRDAIFKAESLEEFLGAKVQAIKDRVENSKTALKAKILQLAAEKEGQSTVTPDASKESPTNAVDDAVTIY